MENLAASSATQTSSLAFRTSPATSRPRVLIADDHQLVREGLSKLLQNDVELVGSTSSGTEAVELAAALQPDIVLMDISMRQGLNGFEAMRQLKEKAPHVKVIAVTMHNSPAYLREAMKAGMAGFVLKQSAASELATAVHAAMRNERYVTPLLSEYVEEGPESRERELTSRQCQVLRLIAQGCIAKQIAARLGISVRTAEFHRVSIMQKLALHTTAELTRYAIERGIAE